MSRLRPLSASLVGLLASILVSGPACAPAGQEEPAATSRPSPTGRASEQAEPEASSAPRSELRPTLALSPHNLLRNPSFEQGRDPWYSMSGPDRPYWADFELSREQARSGHTAALLALTDEGYGGETRIYGTVQEVAPMGMPRTLEGWWRVDAWRRGADKQYLQVVLIVWNPQGIPGHEDSVNLQISWVLGGITSPPFRIGNRKFYFLGNREPEAGEWRRVRRDLHADFEEAWGAVPTGFTKLRILWEVRYDGRPAEAPPARARVFYDDLYLGP